MKTDKKIIFAIFFLLGILFMSCFVSASYMRTNFGVSHFKETGLQGYDGFDKSMCEAGQDFIIQIAPFGCTPAVVRSDLLEEQNVPIFCQLAATKINPLIEVEAIESISFTGEYPEEVSGIGFHPANAALGVKGNLNSPILNNIGYTVIVLKKQQNASAMPDFVEGELTAKIKYDIKNAFGIGKASFYLPEFTDLQWEEKYTQYGFWNSRAYLKAEEIENDRAIISIYDNTRKISSSVLEKGETSEKIYLPGFDCLAGLELKLNDIKNPDTRAKLRINADVVEVAEGEKFLDNKCYVKDLEKRGIVQKVNIRCREDDGVKSFDLGISPKVILNIDGEEKEVSLGDKLYDRSNVSKSVYLGYMGSKGNNENLEDLFLYFVSIPENREKLSGTKLSSVNNIVKTFIHNKITGIGLVDVTANIFKTIGALSILSAKFIVEGESYSRLAYAVENEIIGSQEIFGKNIEIIGFAEAQDKELDDESAQYYENAMKDYEIIINNFAGEKHPEDESLTFDELALVEEIKLLRDIGKKKTMVELCEEFKEKYPNSAYKSELEECYDSYKLSNTETTNNYVLINGRVKKISFDGIYEPSLEDYSVKIVVGNAGNYSGVKILQKNEKKDFSENETISLKELENDYAIFDISNIEESLTKKLGSQTLKINLYDYKIVGKNNYQIRVEEINLKKIAQVSVIPEINNVGTEATFKFKIGIEQRTIQLSPEKTQEKINELNKTINDWEEKSEGLGKVVKGLKTACLATGAALTIKNFFANTGGKAIARQTVMRGEGGWYEQCADLVETNVYENQEQCMVEEAPNIDRDVELVSEIMNGQNIQVKELEKEFTEKKFLAESVVDTDKFMNKYAPLVQRYLSDNFGEKFTNPDNPQESIDMNTMISTLSYESWKNNSNYNKAELRDIQLYSMVLQNPDTSPELREMTEKRLYSVFSDVKINAVGYAKRNSISGDFGVDQSTFAFLEIDKDVKKIVYGGLIYENIKGKAGLGPLGIEDTMPVQFLQTSSGEMYILVLDDSAGTGKMPIKKMSLSRDEGGGEALMIYDLQGNKIPDSEIPIAVKNSYFQKYDASSYKNKFKSSLGETVPLVRYYETEPYKGFPAIVPFDLNNGWYAATKQTLPVLGNIKAYDDSGRVTSFWLCNVGKNGREENIGGDDTCQMINLGTGQPYNQFPGLTGKEASARVTAGVKAIEQASRQYKSGVSTVNINVGYGNLNIRVGSPSVDIPDMQCQDFMSPKDCQLLFNVCDPVICPSSRCDFGGAYPVKDVIQSGIIGSLMLCLPNVKEGIYIPICLSGLKAGIDGYLSVLTSHRDCLQHSLDTGETVGICDEIYSIHLCEFFWRQTLPLAKLIIPKAMEIFLGQGARGGGEYLGVSSAWDNAEKSVDYFTQYYAANSYKAFKARTAEDVGGEFCKVSVSGVYPDSGNLLDSLVEPDSPPQFHGRFDEIPFTSATVPPISHYKVFYHIFAGKDSGAYYQVYLKGATGSSFYQDTSNRRIVASGYIGVGEYASETSDFTAPAGYQEMCINVNGQEECGFKQVSTSFAVEYVKEKYMASQAEEIDVKTEKECISGSASVYSLLSPNLQEGAEEFINPEIYNRGIIRICGTDNPGKATDAYANGEGARWVEVGYCDNKKIKCWLDTQSVENIIKNTDIEEDVLQKVTENQLDILRNKEGYISHKEFLSNVEKIEQEKNSDTKINLINAILEKVFLNSEKAHLFFLRGNVYAELAVMKYKELIAVEEKSKVIVDDKEAKRREAEEITSEEAREMLEYCNDPTVLLKGEHASVDDCLKSVFGIEDIEELKEKVDGMILEFISPIFEFKDGRVFVTNLFYAYSENGWYWSSDKENWMPTSKIIVEGGRFDGEEPSEENKKFIKDLDQKSYSNGVGLLISRTLKKQGLFNPKLSTDKVDMNYKKEFIFRYKKSEELPSQAFYFKFSENKWMWSDDGVGWAIVPKIAWSGSFYGEPVELIKSLEGKDFYEGAEIIFSESIRVIKKTEESQVKTTGYKIWRIAEELSNRKYNHCRIQDGKTICSYVCAGFVTKVLTDSGVKGIECGLGKGDSIAYLIEEFEKRNDFVEIKKNNLEKGDVIILGLGTKEKQHSAIFSNYENNGEIFRVWGDSDDPQEPYATLQSFRIYGQVEATLSNKWWFYRAFRFTGELEERRDWSFDSSIEKTNFLLKEYGNTAYLQNCDVKNFIEQLLEDGILAESEYDKIVEQDLGDLKKLLIVKTA